MSGSEELELPLTGENYDLRLRARARVASELVWHAIYLAFGKPNVFVVKGFTTLHRIAVQSALRLADAEFRFGLGKLAEVIDLPQVPEGLASDARADLIFLNKSTPLTAVQVDPPCSLSE